MAFNQVGVVAVHRPHQVAHGAVQHRIEAGRKAAGPLDKVGHQVFQLAISLAGEEGFHGERSSHFCGFRCV